MEMQEGTVLKTAGLSQAQLLFINEDKCTNISSERKKTSISLYLILNETTCTYK